jgi:hypothetical protein
VTLQNILKKHTRSRLLLDKEPVKGQLLEELRAHRKLNDILYAVYFGAVLIVLLAAIYALVSGVVTNSSVKIGILGGAGITVTGMLTLIRGAVREWSQSNLLVVLVGQSDETQIQKILDALIAANIKGSTG